MKPFLQLIRVKHWIKNLLIFIPIISAKLITCENLMKTLLAFVSFCLMTSFIYVINDICDIEKDKLHPRKKNRPLPSGKINKKAAIFIAIVLFLLSIILNLIVVHNFLSLSWVFLVIYMLINMAYSFGMKNLVLIDIFLLVSGFIIRLYYGASIINIEISQWLFLTVLNAALFLVLGKRKKELEHSKKSRKVLDEYNSEFLAKFQYLTLSLTLVFYSLWTTIQPNKFMFLTVPFITLIFMKYSLIIETNDDGDPTTVLYKDKLLFGLCIIYLILMIILIGV